MVPSRFSFPSKGGWGTTCRPVEQGANPGSLLRAFVCVTVFNSYNITWLKLSPPKHQTSSKRLAQAESVWLTTEPLLVSKFSPLQCDHGLFFSLAAMFHSWTFANTRFERSPPRYHTPNLQPVWQIQVSRSDRRYPFWFSELYATGTKISRAFYSL